MEIFDFDDYKKYVGARLKAMPTQGRGEFQRMAAHLRVHSTLMSQIFRGSKDLTLEQACALSEYLKLDSLETEYFLALVHRERAGTTQYREIVQQSIDRLKIQGLRVKAPTGEKSGLTAEDMATLLSHWWYDAIHQATGIAEYQTVEALAEYLTLPVSVVKKVAEFLVTTGLCEREGDRIRPRHMDLHFEDKSPHALNYFKSWRLKAIEHFPRLRAGNVAFSSCVTIAEKDADAARKLLMDALRGISELAAKSKREKIYALNVDWFDV